MSCGSAGSFFPNPSDVIEEHFRRKTKISKNWEKPSSQTYIGEALHENLHGHGFYFKESGEKIFYDGLFYANKLEGYAQVFYNDGCNFQGIFKKNIRFGPGVFTYPNGEQDVGFWKSNTLLRMAGSDPKNLVPRLTSTCVGQMQLVKFKYMVPVRSKNVDIAYDILKKLGANANVLRESYKLYNMDVQNHESMFCNKKHFNSQFHRDEDCAIEVVTSKNNETNSEPSDIKDVAAGSDLNEERTRQIIEILEMFKKKLAVAKRKRLAIEKETETCRNCCLTKKGAGDYAEYIGEEGYNPVECSHFERHREEDDKSEKDNQSNKEEIKSQEIAFEHVAANAYDADTFTYVGSTGSGGSTARFIDQSSNHSIPFERMDFSRRIDDYMSTSTRCICEESAVMVGLEELERQLEAANRDETFFRNVVNGLSEKLRKHLNKLLESDEVCTTKIVVSDILAWNNEQFCINMQKHCFLHRKSEYMVDFKVSDLVAGYRDNFGKPGLMERSCSEYLRACADGDIAAVRRLLRSELINENVCDCAGNNGIFFAAIHGHQELIKVLASLGIKVDQENDEGLVALNVCLLMYLARKNRVDDWEQGFLPRAKDKIKPYRWYPISSTLTGKLRRRLSISSSNNCSKSLTSMSSSRSSGQPYVFSTRFNALENLTKVRSQPKLAFLEQTLPSVALQTVKNTIRELLKCGANPNMTAVPLPALFLAVYTENPDLVTLVLQAHADVDTTIEDDLTCLHVIASSKCIPANIEIAHLLVAYHCDPRAKTSCSHWPDQKEYILGEDNKHRDNVEDEGKNPLHLLCMRTDFHTDKCTFFEQMATIIGHAGVDYNEKYLGHTPLSLATLMGNKDLVEALMNVQTSDPHQLLGYDMGNVLTIYILKRYKTQLPRNSKEILTYLVHSGVNLFNPIASFENAIAFMEEEHNDKVGVKGRKLRNMNTTKKGRKLQTELRSYMKELARNTILQYIISYVVENLYNFIEEGCEHPSMHILSDFLTPEIALSCLKYLFNYNKIKSERYDKDICLRLIYFIEHRKIRRDANENKLRAAESSVNSLHKRVKLNHSNYSVILDLADFKRLKKSETNQYILPPGFDDTSKYKVCFHCLMNGNKDLIVCPRCQLIYFCSDQCNKDNLSLRLHPCNNNFYLSELKKSACKDSLMEQERFDKIYEKIRMSCDKRWRWKMEERTEMQKKQFGIEMKSDTYGTKMLRKIKEMNAAKTSSLESLRGSMSRLPSGVWPDNQNHQDSLQTTSNSMSTGPKRLSMKLPVKKKIISCEKTGTKDRKKEPLHEKSKMFAKESRTMKGKSLNSDDGKEVGEKFKVVKGQVDVNAGEAVWKLRMIPLKSQRFFHLLAENFPQEDLSSLLLPYTCYSDGNLYYKFVKGDYYTSS